MGEMHKYINISQAISYKRKINKNTYPSNVLDMYIIKERLTKSICKGYQKIQE